MARRASNHPNGIPERLLVARSPVEASIVVAVLRSEGIPVWTDQSLMADEFTVAQTLMNLQQVSVFVPRHRLEDARFALAASKQAASILDDAAAARRRRFRRRRLSGQPAGTAGRAPSPAATATTPNTKANATTPPRAAADRDRRHAWM